MSEIFNIILYQPLLNSLILIYNILPIKDIGIAIIILTVLIRAILWPLQKKTIEAQKKMKDLQPKMNEINKNYKSDPQKRGTELMKLYKEHNANPASSCLPLLIQLPILWAMFTVFKDGLKAETLKGLYGFVAQPQVIDQLFLNISSFDLAKPNIILTVITAAVQFFQTKMFSTANPALQTTESKDENMQTMLNKQMLYIMPVVTVVIGIKLPSGLMLYWLVSTLLMWLQQWWEFRNPLNSKNQIPN